MQAATLRKVRFHHRNNRALRRIFALCSGLSNCHKLSLIALKTTIPKNNPRQIACRDYKKFDS